MTTTSTPTDLWLTQLRPGFEQGLGRKLLSKFRFVTYSQLAQALGNALHRMGNREHVGVFIEREIPHRWTREKQNIPTWSMRSERRRTGFRPISRKVLRPVRMYKEQARKVARGMKARLRAVGAALPPVRSVRNDLQTTGSEGILATIASSAASTQRALHVHPSANHVRKQKIRHFVVLTDFIGSGTRLTTVLDSLWRVRSVRSWWSGQLVKISVLAYSATQAGIDRVKAHPCRPDVIALVPCPTVHSAFAGKELGEIIRLCERRAPAGSQALGYGNVGALIAFEHSCPNNVPAIFTETSTLRLAPWQALFPARSTRTVFQQLGNMTRRQRDALALETLGLPAIAQRAAFERSSESARNMVLVLASLHRGHRSLDEVATTTLLALSEVAAAIDRGTKDGYLDLNQRLSAAGLSLLRKLGQSGDSRPVTAVESLYYPQSLRDPV